MRIFLSYCHANLKYADQLNEVLHEASPEVTIVRDIRDLQPFMNLKEFMERIRESDFTITLLSQEYLKSRNCMYEICELIKEDKIVDSYLNKTIPIILPSALESGFNIFNYEDHYNYIEFWEKKFEEIESKLLQHEKKKSRSQVYETKRNKLIKDASWITDIYQNINTFIEDLNDILCVTFNECELDGFRSIIERIHPTKYQIDTTYNSRELRAISDRIIIPSNSDPNRPEFPYGNPKFPATDIKTIYIPDFGEVLIKDESVNPTGTHKDRMAWEVIVHYKKIIDSISNNGDGIKLPRISIISSGSSAAAIQYLLRYFRLPNLKVLAPHNLPEDVKTSLKAMGCILYFVDLTKKWFTSAEVLEITQNPNGIDASLRELVDPQEYFYYDWMSYEILNENPDYIYLPFATGELFINLLNINKIECVFRASDKRFTGDIKVLKQTNFIGATTDRQDSKCFKLYTNSNFVDIDSLNKTQIQRYIRLGACGRRTKIDLVKESFVDKAITIANDQNIQTEPSGIAGLALFLQQKSKIPAGKKVLVINTGKAKYIH